MENPKEIFTEEDCKAALGHYLESNDFKVKSYTVRSFSDNVEGLIGQHFLITTEYEYENSDKTIQFFMKILNPACKVAFEVAMSINAYEKEVCFYKSLVPEFKKYKIDVSYAPLSYFSKPHLIVLEDLSLKGFRMVNKKDMFDLIHLKKALICLARFHTSSIIYEELKSKKLNQKFSLGEIHAKDLEDKLFSGDGNFAARWLRVSFMGIEKLIDFLPQNHVTKEMFKTKLKEVFESLPEITRPSEKYRNCVIHGDLWTNNFMFTYQDDHPVDTNLIDFQLLKYAPPAVDVVQLIVTDMRRELRNKHFSDLLDFYYSNFSKNLSEHDLDANVILPKSEFLETCEIMQIPVRLQALADHSITFMSAESWEVAAKDDESFRAFLYDDRSEGILDSFRKEDLYREVMSEDLLDLRDAMFKS